METKQKGEKRLSMVDVRNAFYFADVLIFSKVNVSARYLFPYHSLGYYLDP